MSFLAAPIYMDVIASNADTVKPYKQFDFEISSEYYGRSGSNKKLLCYHMM